jgi:hypothetical protein
MLFDIPQKVILTKSAYFFLLSGKPVTTVFSGIECRRFHLNILLCSVAGFVNWRAPERWQIQASLRLSKLNVEIFFFMVCFC